jgi:hypothetical protein
MNTDEKRAYFSRLSHAQLVDLLVDISSKNPELTMPSATSIVQQKTFSPVPASPKPKVEDEEGYRKHPRAGHGFALSREPADLDILKEDPALKTFSHTLNISDTSTPRRVWGQVTTFGRFLLE